MAQQLTLKEIKKKGLAAYKAGTLTAQAKNPADRMCAYEVGYCKCVIGSALSAETLQKIHAGHLNRHASIHKLMEDDIVNMNGGYDGEEYQEARQLQSLHDAWATASQRYGESNSATIEERDTFLRRLEAA
jgi:hypothetical protein